MKTTEIATAPKAHGRANVIEMILFLDANQDVPHGAHR